MTTDGRALAATPVTQLTDSTLFTTTVEFLPTIENAAAETPPASTPEAIAAMTATETRFAVLAGAGAAGAWYANVN